MKKILAILITMFALPLTATDLYKQLSYDNTLTQESIHARIRTSYEVVPLSATQNMGMVGTHLDWFPFESSKSFYSSFGFYSAMTGEEGGFFTFGYTLGVDYKFDSNFHLDTGFYAGGGAGEYIGFPNGGMMLTTHAALSYELKGVELALGLSRTDFPNTPKNKDFQSDIHPYVGLNISNEIWTDSSKIGYGKKLNSFDGLFNYTRITPAIVMYKIDNKPTKRSDRYKGDALYQEDFPMLGIQLDKFFTDKLFFSMEAYGALSSAAGYAAIQTGVGYDMKLFDFVSWESKMVVGSAGDGRIDTGGGFIAQPMTGFRLHITPSLSLKALAGRTYAPNGLFSATTYEGGISWQANRPVPKRGSYSFSLDEFSNLKWVMSPSLKMYFPYDSTHKKSKEESQRNIALPGITMAVPLNDWLSLTGSTHWAMIGNIGSYAEGLFGIRLLTPEFTPLNIRAKLQAEAGAGAGSGVNTSSGGFVGQTLAGLELPVSKHSNVGLDVGDMKTSDGKFQAKTVLLSLNINLNFIYKK